MRTKLYPFFLHAALIALVVAVVALGHENRRLRGLLSPELPRLEIGAEVAAAEVVSLDGAARVLDARDGVEAGGRLLLVFTTSCPACRENQDAWRALHDEVAGAIDVVGISLDDAAATRTYRDRHDLAFEVVVAADRQRFTADYEVPVVPSTILLGPDGRVHGVWQGALTPATRREIAADARAL